ncbi:ORF14 [Fowl adenovirus 8b]|uniref:ORF14 n=2 Tax=Fowl aviadenovirus E TaxID=190065 RepID=A0A191UM14_9ADEN|nr:ORF14 [Fowl aviadenovirus 7]ANJ02554.1 ORF14 [Fowl adenovirus 8b]
MANRSPPSVDLDYRFHRDFLGDTCQHTYTVNFSSPYHYVSALLFFDRRFLAFLRGRALCPFPSEPFYVPSSFPFRLRPFRSQFAVQALAKAYPKNAYRAAWTVSYVCECEEPMSLFCQALAAFIIPRWHRRICDRPVDSDPFPVHFDRFVSRLCRHCPLCHHRSPVEVLDNVVNIYRDSTRGDFVMVRVVAGAIRLTLPRTHKHFRHMPCFLHVLKTFPYPVSVEFL